MYQTLSCPTAADLPFAAYFLNACAISLKLGDYVNIGSWSYYHTNVGNNSIINTLSLVFSQYD